MKYLFALLAILLVISSLGLRASYPDAQSEVPVLYWVTDNNPARQQQIAIFHQWLLKQGQGEAVVVTNDDELEALRARHLTRPLIDAMRAIYPDAHKVWPVDESVPVAAINYPLEVRIPPMEMRTDNANRDDTKQVIQGVSGVGGDAIDTGGQNLPYMYALGITTDLNAWGKEMGFDTSKTYPAIVPNLTVVDYANPGSEDTQLAFPCNVTAEMYWVNKATFEKLGLPLPPKRWTIEEFESMGKRFVAAANKPGERQTAFFSMSLDKEDLTRSMGLSYLNETLTRCTADDPRFARALGLIHKWTYEDHILPSAAERSSFDTESGYGGSVLQLFNRGNVGMFRMGRYALIQLRKFGNLEMTAVEPPHAGFPVTIASTRCAYLYRGGHPELAKWFLSYLASEDYNMQVVRDADALPPNPQYTKTEEYIRPKDYPNEWGLHEAFADAMDEIAIAHVSSPFVLYRTMQRHINDAEAAVMANSLSPEAAAQQAAREVNEAIARTLQEQPRLQPIFDRLSQDQAEIDRLRAAGQKVPRRLIANPFYLKYYAAQGWLEDPQPVASPESALAR